MVGRVVATVGLAILAGIAFSLRDLVLPPSRQVPLPLKDLVLLGWFLALAAIGWATGQLVGPPAGVLAAPAATVVAILAKQVRYPETAPTGDGSEVLSGCMPSSVSPARSSVYIPLCGSDQASAWRLSVRGSSSLPAQSAPSVHARELLRPERR